MLQKKPKTCFKSKPQVVHIIATFLKLTVRSARLTLGTVIFINPKQIFRKPHPSFPCIWWGCMVVCTCVCMLFLFRFDCLNVVLFNIICNIEVPDRFHQHFSNLFVRLFVYHRESHYCLNKVCFVYIWQHDFKKQFHLLTKPEVCLPLNYRNLKSETLTTHYQIRTEHFT